MARVLKGFHSFTCTPTCSSAIGMSHTCLCLPSRSWYSFTDPGGMEGWVDLGVNCEVAPADIRTRNLPLANPALYHTATSARIGADRGYKNWGLWGPSLGIERSWPLNMYVPHVCYLPNLYVLGQTVGTSVIMEINRTFLPLASYLSRSHKQHESIGYFLLLINSNHGPILYRFRNKRRFRSKIEKFPTPVYLTCTLRGSIRNFVTAVGLENTGIEVRNMTICTFA